MKLSRRVLKGKADGSSGGEIEASTFELYSFHFYLARARARARAPAWISNSYNSGRGRACCRVADLGFGVHMKIFEADGQESIFNWSLLFEEEEISVCAKFQPHPLRSVRDLENSLILQ